MAIRNKPTAHWRNSPSTKNQKGQGWYWKVSLSYSPWHLNYVHSQWETEFERGKPEEPSLRKILQVIKNASCEQKKNGRSLLSEKYLIMWHLQLYKYHTLFLSILVGSMENRTYLNSFTFRAQIYNWWVYLWGKSYITVTSINNKIQISINHLKTKYCKNHVSHEEVLNARSQKVYIKIIPCLSLLTTTAKHHRLSSLNNRNFFLTILEPGNSKMKVLAGKFHSESFFSWIAGVCHHTVCSHDPFFVHMLERNHELSDVCPP